MGVDRSVRSSQRDRRRNVRGAHRYKRGRRWWAYIPKVGRISLGTADEREAEIEFRRHLDARRAGRGVGNSTERPLAEIARAYIDAPHGWTRRTQRSARYRALEFVSAMAAIGVTLPSQITDDALNKWRKARGSAASAATINRGEDVARKMLRWAREHAPPLAGPTPMDSRKRVREAARPEPPLIPSPAEIARIVRALPNRGLQLTVTVAAATGMRVDELRHLRPEHVERDVIVVRPEAGPADTAWSSKGWRERRIPVPVAVAKLAREFADWRVTEGRVLSDHWCLRALAAACAAIKYEPAVGMHEFRRTFVTEAHRSGVPLTVIQQWVGHRDIRTTQRYLGRYRSDAALVAPAPAAVAVMRGVVELSVHKSYKTRGGAREKQGTLKRRRSKPSKRQKQRDS